MFKKRVLAKVDFWPALSAACAGVEYLRYDHHPEGKKMSSPATIFILLIVTLFSFILVASGQEGLVDHHESCDFWASIGECDANPGYMLSNCAKSCDAIVLANNQPLPASFYEITEKDLEGRDISFEQFRGKVVYVVNVASYCGYTESNYELIRRLQRYKKDGLVILLAPCNGFGAQEPGDAQEIRTFAAKKGYEGIILSKGEVNGVQTRPIFRYLKNKAKKSHISW